MEQSEKKFKQDNEKESMVIRNIKCAYINPGTSTSWPDTVSAAQFDQYVARSMNKYYDLSESEESSNVVSQDDAQESRRESGMEVSDDNNALKAREEELRKIWVMEKLGLVPTTKSLNIQEVEAFFSSLKAQAPCSSKSRDSLQTSEASISMAEVISPNRLQRTGSNEMNKDSPTNQYSHNAKDERKNIECQMTIASNFQPHTLNVEKNRSIVGSTLSFQSEVGRHVIGITQQELAYFRSELKGLSGKFPQSFIDSKVQLLELNNLPYSYWSGFLDAIKERIEFVKEDKKDDIYRRWKRISKKLDSMMSSMISTTETSITMLEIYEKMLYCQSTDIHTILIEFRKMMKLHETASAEPPQNSSRSSSTMNFSQETSR